MPITLDIPTYIKVIYILFTIVAFVALRIKYYKDLLKNNYNAKFSLGEFLLVWIMAFTAIVWIPIYYIFLFFVYLYNLIEKADGVLLEIAKKSIKTHD